MDGGAGPDLGVAHAAVTERCGDGGGRPLVQIVAAVEGVCVDQRRGCVQRTARALSKCRQWPGRCLAADMGTKPALRSGWDDSNKGGWQGYLGKNGETWP